MTALSSPAVGMVEGSPRSPASPIFARALFRSATAACTSPSSPATAHTSPRTVPARFTAVLRAELQRSLWSDSPPTAPVPSTAPPPHTYLHHLQPHAARRSGSAGIQRRLVFDQTLDFIKSLAAPTDPLQALPTTDKLSLPPLSGDAQHSSLLDTPSSLLPPLDATTTDGFLHPSAFLTGSPRLPPRHRLTPNSSPQLSSSCTPSGFHSHLPASPSSLPVPDFTLHDVNQRRSPMRPQRIRDRPECPETPMRAVKRQQVQQPATLFQPTSRSSRQLNGDINDEWTASDGADVHRWSRADSLVEEMESEADTDGHGLTTPASSPPAPTSRLSRLSAECRLDHFELEEEVGTGSFSRVWRARKLTTGSLLGAVRGGDSVEQYAIISSKQPMVSNRDHDRFARHSQLLRRLASPPTASPSPLYSDPGPPLSLPFNDWPPHLLRHHALWIENGYVHALTDFFAMGDVRSFFSAEQRPELHVWQLLHDIATALQHLAMRQLLHFDVKPSNILVSPASTTATTPACLYRFVLADLGSLVTYEELATHSDLLEGDGNFLAPEVLCSPKARLTSAVDVFALGRTGLACVTGELLGATVAAGSLHCMGVSAELSDCLCGMLEEAVDKRLSLSDIIARAKQFVGRV